MATRGQDGAGTPAPAEPAATDSATVKRRAARGLVTVGMRSVVVRALGLLGNVVLAPLLGPSGYGVVALGLTAMTVGKFLADGGLNPGFIGRKAPPSRRELQALAAFQLGVTTMVTAVVASIAAWQGSAGVAITLMAAALMIDAWRVPTVIHAERALAYGPIVRAEIVEVVVYNIAAIALVVGGVGVLGVGIATILKSSVGTTLIVVSGDVGLVRPRWDVGALRSTARFGLFFQGAWLATIVRDEGLNLIIVASAGTAVLGAWALARRLLIVVTVLFESAWRVALPGLARLLESGENPRSLLERGVSFAATGTGFPVATLVGATPALVPLLFGDRFDATVSAVPWLAAGLMLAVPIGTVLASLLWAQGQAGKVFRMGIPSVLVTLALGAFLSGPLGTTGAGIAFAAGQASFLVGCLLEARPLVGRVVVGHLAAPLLAAFIGAATGWAAAVELPSPWLGAPAGATLALLTYAAIVAALDRTALRRVLGVMRRSVAPQAA